MSYKNIPNYCYQQFMKLIFILNFILLTCFFLNSFDSKGQLSDVQVQEDLLFYSDSTYMSSHESLIKSAKLLGFRYKRDFVFQWRDLSENTRITIYDINDFLKKNGYDPRTTIKYFLTPIALIQKLQGEKDLINYLNISRQSLSQLSKNEFNSYLKNIISFLENHRLYQYQYNYLQTQDSSFILKYARLPETYKGMSSILDTVIYMPVQGQVSLISLNDQLILEDVEGIYLPHKNLFIAKSAIANWGIHFLDKKLVFVKMQNFIFKATDFHIEANESFMTYKQDDINFQDIEGKFTYIKRQKAEMPVFQSYHDYHKIPVRSDIILIGGFTLRGKTISISSLDSKKANLNVYVNGKTKFNFFTEEGIIFNREDSVLKSKKGEVRFMITDQDTIFHPAMSLHFDIFRNKLVNRKDKNNYKKHPFTNQLHKVLIDADQVSWLVDEDSIYFDILNAKEDIPLVIESDKYFDDYKYKRLQGLLSYSPLKIAIYYSQRIKKRKFKIDDLAWFYKKNAKAIRASLLNLVYQGFADYNATKDELTLKKRAYFYYSSANALRLYKNNLERKNQKPYTANYDQIRFTSRVTHGHNAIYTPADSLLTIAGAKNFTISDSLNIVAKPEGNIIHLRPNRDIAFDGSIQAGQTIFYGNNLIFLYDSFNIDMTIVDSISFLLPDSLNANRFIELPNKILNTRAKLYLSEPLNKSGLKKYPEYPKLSMLEKSIVDFDGNEILNGVYDSSVYFTIPPFSQDSLENFNPLKLKLSGTFKSGIFPDFKEVLRIQEDYSLGFQEHKVPKKGFKLFENKDSIEDINFQGAINLDNRGITSNGQIKYITSTLNSEAFVYYQDSITTKSGRGEITVIGDTASIYPDVILPNYSLLWKINGDSMLLTTKDTLFDLYEGLIDFGGTLIYGKTSLMGDGEIVAHEYNEISSSFLFLRDTYTSESSSLSLKRDSIIDLPAMAAHNVETHHDLTNHITTLNKNDPHFNSFVFPRIGYKSSIEKAVWLLDSNKIILSNQEKAADFISTNPEEDSLKLSGTNAVYDKKGGTLRITDLEPIIVANNEIIPADSTAIIREGKGIDEILNAQIYINRDTRYHHLSNAKIKIKSSHSFNGSGLYNFQKNDGEIVQIKFNSFDIQRVSQLINELSSKQQKKLLANTKGEYITQGTAKIPFSEPLSLFDGLNYYGNIFLKDNIEGLSLDGNIGLKIKRPNNAYFSYKSETANNYTKIKIDENLKSIDDKKLLTGIYRDIKNQELFGSFIEEVENRKYATIFQTDGNLVFNKDNKTYQIVPENKKATNFLIQDTIKVGNALVYNHNKKLIDFTGNIQLLEPNNDFDLKTTAIGQYSIENKSFSANTLLLFKTAGIGNMLTNISKHFEFIPSEDGKDMPQEDIILRKNIITKIAQIVDNSTFSKLDQTVLNDNYLSGLFRDFVVFSNLDLEWSNDFSAFFNPKGKARLANILSQNINNDITVYIEIPKDKNDNIFTLFLISNDEEWYFLEIEKNKLTTLSSNAEYNILASTNKKTALNINIGDYDEIVGYVDHFRRDYLKLERPLDLREPIKIVTQKGKVDNKEEEEIEQEEEVLLDDIIEDSEPDLDIEDKKKNKDTKKRKQTKKEEENDDEFLLDDGFESHEDDLESIKLLKEQEEKERQALKKKPSN